MAQRLYQFSTKSVQRSQVQRRGQTDRHSFPAHRAKSLREALFTF
jgi:hypothetical protein